MQSHFLHSFLVDTREKCLAEVPRGPKNPGTVLFWAANTHCFITIEMLILVTMASQHRLDTHLQLFFKYQFKEYHNQYLFPLTPVICLEPLAWRLLLDFGFGFTDIFTLLLWSARGMAMVTKKTPERITNPQSFPLEQLSAVANLAYLSLQTHLEPLYLGTDFLLSPTENALVYLLTGILASLLIDRSQSISLLLANHSQSIPTVILSPHLFTIQMQNVT